MNESDKIAEFYSLVERYKEIKEKEDRVLSYGSYPYNRVNDVINAVTSSYATGSSDLRVPGLTVEMEPRRMSAYMSMDYTTADYDPMSTAEAIRPAGPQEGTIRLDPDTMTIQAYMNGTWRRIGIFEGPITLI